MLTYQITSMAIGFSLAAVILFLVRRDHLHGPYAIWWIGVAVTVSMLGFFPRLFDYLASHLGIGYPPILAVVLGFGLLLLKILTMDLENPSNRYLREPLAALGLIPAMELDSYLALIELAKAGIGPVLLPAGLLALVGEQGTQARPLPGLGRPLHLVYRPNSLKRDRIARLVQALQAHFRQLTALG